MKNSYLKLKFGKQSSLDNYHTNLSNFRPHAIENPKQPFSVIMTVVYRIWNRHSTLQLSRINVTRDHLMV